MKVLKGSNVANVDDCVKRLAEKRGIPVVEAESIFNDCMEVICDFISEGGVAIRDSFTIRKIMRQGRKGVIRGEEFKSRDKYLLKIRAGKKLSESMNLR